MYIIVHNIFHQHLKKIKTIRIDSVSLLDNKDSKEIHKLEKACIFVVKVKLANQVIK